MAVFRGSRYEGCKLGIDPNGIQHLKSREISIKPEDSDYVIRFRIGDRLDIIADKFYGDSHLQWIILDANPQYYAPSDIKPGDYLVIPNPERVIV